MKRIILNAATLIALCLSNSLAARLHHLDAAELRKLLIDKQDEFHELRKEITTINEAEITLIKTELESAEIAHEIETLEDSIRALCIHDEVKQSNTEDSSAALEKRLRKQKAHREHAHNQYTMALSRYLRLQATKPELIRRKETIFGDMEDMLEKLRPLQPISADETDAATKHEKPTRVKVGHKNQPTVAKTHATAVEVAEPAVEPITEPATKKAKKASLWSRWGLDEYWNRWFGKKEAK